MEKQSEQTKLDEVRAILLENGPTAAQYLCDMLADETITGTTKVSVAKEILERAVGKGQLAELEQERNSEFTLILKVVE